MNISAVRQLVAREEALRLKPYRDTKGKLTIGYGRNLDDVGITDEEALLMLEHDIRRSVSDAMNFSWFTGLSETRQNVIVSMLFNLGLPKFSEFKRMHAAIVRGDWDAAANEMMSSAWAAEVKSRAVELAGMMKNG
jgi:lysozyme